jgi:Ti-type conjugative transfer relaxase TraA
MAIYHFSAKVISRAAGSSALAAAAYRSASRLHDQRLDRHHDFSNKAGVIHSEVMLPDHAPAEFSDRERLWNAVEGAEIRKDAQLAREVEFAIPRELDQSEGIRLARDFVDREFVQRGMIADLNVHWDIGGDGEPKPHAHVMLTMREVGEDGFGQKVRDWNRTGLLEHWREAWADHVNERLAALDIDARVDHRSLEAQGIDLEPQHKIGPAASRMAGHGLELERVDEHRDIARANGEKLLANPNIALDAITHQQATFTTRDLARFVHRHSERKVQFDRVFAAVRGSPELVALGRDGRGEERFTSCAMLETEQRLERATKALASRDHHGVTRRHRDTAMVRAAGRHLLLSPKQRSAFEHVTEGRGLSVVIGYAGSGKSAMLGAAREAWEGEGYSVRGAALSGIAAESLEAGSGIPSRTLASLEHQWAQGRELLGAKDVLVIDEAGMIGTRQMERVIAQVEKRRAKVVLVGDPEQLQAIEAGAAFRATAERHGSVEITDIRRQREDWQRHATRQLATGRTAEAIRSYEERGHVHAGETREQARTDLIDCWGRDRHAAPEASRIILTHTNDEVLELNIAARERLRSGGELGEDVPVRTERGQRRFAAGDRMMFLRNERCMGVKNGTLGRIDSVGAARMAVLLDDGRSVAFDMKDYAAIDHGYAATVHKAQGVTVDRVHVLATPGLDRHAAYVALSRHRDSVDLHYGRDDFADQGRLVRALSRERGKDMASDYGQDRSAKRIEIARAARPTGIGGLKLRAKRRPERARSMFDGLKLRASPVVSQWGPDRGDAVMRYARAFAAADEARRRGRQPMPHELLAVGKAGDALDRIEADTARDLRSAFARDPSLVDKARQGEIGAAQRALEVERAVRLDPAKRAERFVRDWRTLQRREQALTDAGHHERARQIGNGLSQMAKSLHRDPQLESLLRNRRRELGIGSSGSASMSHDLLDSLSFSRSRGIGR